MPHASPPPRWSRRDLLAAAAAGAAGVFASSCRARLAGERGFPVEPKTGDATARSATGRAPAVFVGHGSPELARDAVRGGDLARFAASMPKPNAILAISAHWEAAPATIGAVEPVPLVYDFGGFPRPLYEMRYPAPGAPSLASRVEAALAPLGGTRRDPARGLDHGVWVPLLWMYPRADVPVLQLSLPTEDGARLAAIGRALAPLRDEGVMILGSGNLVHNLRRLSRDGSPPPTFASEFDAWVTEALVRRDLDALIDHRRKAPASRLAHPTIEHYVPLLVAVGAGGERDPVAFPVTGFEGGSVSRRCVRFG